jgi:hypothetical protein
MTIIERVTLYSLALGIMYLGIINPHYPWLLFVIFIVFGVLIFLWILLPILKVNNIAGRLRDVAYFEKYRIPKLLLYTFVVLVGILKIDIHTDNGALVVLFMICKIMDSVIIEVILVLRILIDPEDELPG